MHSELRVGHTHRLEYKVRPNRLVRHLLPELDVFQSGQPVFATGYMAGILEAPCMAALRTVLDDDEAPVGTRIDIAHVAASLPGNLLLVDAECVLIHGPYHEFAVRAMDGDRLAASGTIGQTVVNVQRFQASWPKPHAAVRAPHAITPAAPILPDGDPIRPVLDPGNPETPVPSPNTTHHNPHW